MLLRSFFPALGLFSLVCALALPVSAQQKRVSPHETVSRVIDGSRVTVVYGRPYAADPKSGETREIWGKLVPYGKVWRAGADEATLLITQKPLVLGGVTVPAGAHSLFFQPEANGSSKLIINRQIGHWGTQHDATQDFARVDVTKETLPAPTDQFTVVLDKGTDGGGVLRLQWATTQFSVPFKVQN